MAAYSANFLIDANLSEKTPPIPVGPYSTAVVQIVQESTGAGAKFRVSRSLDGKTFVAFPKPINLYTSGMTLPFSLEGVTSIRVETTSADATSGAKVRVYVHCE